MAGLLNVLAMLDVYAFAERRWLAGDSEPEPATQTAEVTPEAAP